MKTKDADRIKIDGGYQHRALTQGFRAQRFWHYTKVLAIQELLPPSPGDVIFDVGCGSGVVTSFLGESGARVTGIDGNHDAIEYAKRRFCRPNVSFVEGLVDRRMPTDAPVDKIYCLEVIEHIYRPQAAKMFRAFHQALRTDGEVFLTTPNYHSVWPLLEWILDCSGLVPAMAQDQHVELYHRSKLVSLSSECGFRVRRLASAGLVSPWLAILNWKLGERGFRWEHRLRSCPGPILIAVLKKV